MNTKEFTELLDGKGYAYSMDGDVVVVEHDGGDVDLSDVNTLNTKVRFENGGDVDLDGLLELSVAQTFNNDGSVFLDYLFELSVAQTFGNSGDVFLGGLAELSVAQFFNNGRCVYLSDLRELSAAQDFNNGGRIWVPQLDGVYKYQGREYLFKHIDNCSMLITSSKRVGEFNVHKAKYLGGGPVDKLRGCLVAEKDGLFAHGVTIKQAVADVDFKHR